MNKMTLAALTTSLLFFSGSAQATNLLQAYQDAKTSDPSLKAQETAFLATLEDKPQILSTKKPQLSLSGSGSYNQTFDIDDANTSGSASANYTLGLTKSLYNSTLDAQIEQVDASILRAKIQLEEQRQALIMRVAQPYFDYLNAAEGLKFATTEKNAVEQQLKQVKAYFEVGRSPITDLKEAESRYNLAVAQEIAAQQTVIDARENLRIVTGKSYKTLNAAYANLPLTIPAPQSIKGWVNLAKENNKSLQAAQQSIEVSRTTVEVQRSGRSPVVNMYARHTGSLTANDTPIDPIVAGASVGVEASIPLYQGGAHYSKVRQAQHNFRQAQQTYEARERQIESQVRTAYLSIESSISQVKAQQRALTAAETAATATKTGFEVGTRTAVDVLTSLRDVFAARRDYASARNRYLLNTLQLRNAAGTLNEKDLKDMARLLTQPTSKNGRAATGGNTGQQGWQRRKQQARLQAQKRQQQQREAKLRAQRQRQQHESRLREAKQRQLQQQRQRHTKTTNTTPQAKPKSAPNNFLQSAIESSPTPTDRPTNNNDIVIVK